MNVDGVCTVFTQEHNCNHLNLEDNKIIGLASFIDSFNLTTALFGWVKWYILWQ
jgi:hypothetical protein